ncbi:unnamed protein product [Closterium sp. NIES-53]
MASWRSVDTYVDMVPPPGAIEVDGMWIFKVKRPLREPPDFKAHYVATGISRREGVDFFHAFSPTLKLDTLWILLHIAVQRDYKLHALDFSTAFLHGSLHEQIFQMPPSWLHWVFSLLGPCGAFNSPSTVCVRLFLGGTTHCELLWVISASFRFLLTRLSSSTLALPCSTFGSIDNLVFATPNKVALASVKAELLGRHACTDIGGLHHYLDNQYTRERAARAITLTESHMVQQILWGFGLQYSSGQPTPLHVDYTLSAPVPDELLSLLVRTHS